MKEVKLLKPFSLMILNLLGLYTVTRALFLAMNSSLFQNASVYDLSYSFIYGLRFDLVGIGVANGILVLIYVALNGFPGFLKPLARIYFTLINGAFLGLNIMDAEFYKFNGKRFTVDYLENAADVQRHSLSVFITYWWLFLIFVAGMAFLYFIFPRFFPEPKVKLSSWRRAFLSLAAIAFSVLIIRGGVQLKPISLVTAYTQGDQALGALVLNTPFTFIRGHGTGLKDAAVFFDDMTEARQIISDYRGGSESFQRVSDIENVIVIVVESLSLEYTGLIHSQPSYTPFIDQLAQSSLVFKNYYANGRRSIEAMPSIFCGIPSLITAPFITSSLSQNELHCLPEFFKRDGYETAFFHGAHNGSFHMDSFSSKAGFQRFYGFNEYPNEEDFDGSWGILDEPMFQFMAKELSNYKDKFFAGIFTLSSHHPYFIPEHLRNRFKDGPLEIHKSIGYADYSLSQFFDQAQKEPWYEKTLFLITADHTQKNFEKSYQFLSGDYRVPLIVYSESEEFKQRFLPQKAEFERKVAQAVDIPVSILNLLGISSSIPLPPFGGNLFDLNQKGMAVNFDGFQYWMRVDDKVFTMTNDGSLNEVVLLNESGFFTHRQENMSVVSEGEQNLLKALVSFFNQTMRQNSMYRN